MHNNEVSYDNMNVYLHTLFEQQARLYPNAIALKFQNVQITYQELNNKSNQLANYLIKIKVKPEDKVALYFERSINMIVGILGTLKSGATYIPLDPKMPNDRINFFIKDLDNSVIISGIKNIDIASDIHHIISIDDIANESSENPNINFNVNSPAVILYTSGSTGYPKGVLLSHKSLVNRLIWDRNEYKHSINDIVLQHASYNFDFSILEIFMALANGGKLILARPDFHYESFYLIDLIQKEHITKMGSNPSLIKAYINLPAFEKCNSLKQVFLGGETLHYNLQNLFFEKSSAELINIYGPTETSISVLHWKCIRNTTDKIVPIGFPIASMNIYILNENKELVPDGEVGEIYIAGIGVALGYFNRLELTKERFIQNPFINTPKEQMYKTGDLGRKLPSGAYQFIGRKDNQVKIHGLRIELEEIEHYLNLHENIVSSAVLKIEISSGIDKLVAYIVPLSKDRFDIDSLKVYLSKLLPDYMVPGLFIQMDEFPMTLNGKIDRGALPHPDKLKILSNKSYKAAENEIQKYLIDILEKVLKIKPIGINDTLGDIGGDSLALLQIHNNIEKELNITVPISFLSKSLTIESLAKQLENSSEINNSRIQLIRHGKNTPVIFVNPILGESDFSFSLVKYINEEHPVIVTRPFGYDKPAITYTIEEFSQIYAQELERQFSFNEYIVGGYSIGGLVALEMASFLKNRGKTIKLLFLVDTYHPKVFNMQSRRYQLLGKYLFNPKNLSKNNIILKKEIINHLIKLSPRTIKKFVSSFLYINNPEETQRKSHALPNHIKILDIMGIIAKNYNPKPYEDKAILIAAKETPYSGIYPKLNNIENIQNWINKVFNNNSSIYEIPSTHSSIIEDESNVKMVANIINEHLSTN